MTIVTIEAGQPVDSDTSHGNGVLPLKPNEGSRPTLTNDSRDALAIEGLSIRSTPLPHEQYPAPQLEHYHPNHQPAVHQQLQMQQQAPAVAGAFAIVSPHWQQQQQQMPYPVMPPRLPSHQPQQQQPPPREYQQQQSPMQQTPQLQQPQQLQQPPQQLQPLQTQLPQKSRTLTTITATITTNGDQGRTISFEEAQRQQQKKRTQQLSPAVAAQVLTPAQQREIEMDSYIQRGIELHEQNQLEEATYYFRLAAESENPMGQLMYGLSLRHGWGCPQDQKNAIFHLQRAAASAMSELKELMPGSSANIKALQQQQQKQQGISASSSLAPSQPLRRMGTIDRRSAMLTARRELVMALYELGMSFLKGWGVHKDKVAAFHYFKLAADLGDADSQNETAQCFLDGIGTEKDPFEAARYYRLASAQGASQLGNSWIWKPKYDQYCEQKAAAAAAESARKNRQGEQGSSGGLESSGVAGSSVALPAKSIAAGLASMTASATAAPSATASSTIGRHSHTQSLEQGQLTIATGRAAGPASRQGKYNLAGDLISSSQLELKIQQAEQLTKATVGPALEPASATHKKKHRWSLWTHH